MLQRSTLYHRGQYRSLWDNSLSFSGFTPYLVGDAGFSLLPWLMVPHRREFNVSVAHRLFNRKLSRGRSVVKYAFSLLKLSFQELNQKCDMDVSIVPDVVTYCALLHNVLLKESHEDIERLLEVVQMENAQNEARHDLAQPEEVADAEDEEDHSSAFLWLRSRKYDIYIHFMMNFAYLKIFFEHPFCFEISNSFHHMANHELMFSMSSQCSKTSISYDAIITCLPCSVS